MLRNDQPSNVKPNRLRFRLATAFGIAIMLGLALLNYQTGSPRTLGQAPMPVVFMGPSDSMKVEPTTKAVAHLTAKARPAAPSAAKLTPGEALKTAPGDRRRVLLADGTVLYVNENSEVRHPLPQKLELVRGEIFVEVCPKESGFKHAFTVAANGRTFSALCTRFAVRADAMGPGVLVAQGAVTATGFDTPLTAGQEIRPGSTRIESAPRSTHALEWTRDLMSAAALALVPASDKGGGALIALDPAGQEVRLTLRKFHIDVYIEDGFARTTIDQTYFNNDHWRSEGTFYFPLPPDASLSRLAMYAEDGKSCVLNEGGMAERQRARNVYETIRHQQRDPALLEWVDGSTFKMRVFPLEGRKEKRILLSYTQRLPALYGIQRYRFPAGHSMELVRDWSFSARVKHGADLRVTSPSHPVMKSVAKGGELLLTASAKGIKPNKDVVLEILDGANDHASPLSLSPHFRTSVHENHEYLMLRYRPELKADLRAQRRDWVILFESAANRDPLLARAQIEIVRHLLEGAEADDTFSLLTANTRTKLFDKSPRPATGKQIDEAIAWLESSHLVGALDLEKSLDAARPLIAAGKNPHLVHIGAGFPALGERDATKLVNKIPAGVTYVGIGVGKRWNRAFMKQAAEKTAGFFAQLNPDEPLNWGTFDVLATLSTPRLMDVRVADPEGKAIFLTETLALSQGEEICAFTRRDAVKGEKLPARVVVTGTLDGKPFRRVMPVEKAQAGADYLPRTWAKLEIDRLLADGAAKNQALHCKIRISDAHCYSSPRCANVSPPPTRLMIYFSTAPVTRKTEAFSAT